MTKIIGTMTKIIQNITKQSLNQMTKIRYKMTKTNKMTKIIINMTANIKQSDKKTFKA